MHILFDIESRLDFELAAVRAQHPNLGFDLNDLPKSRSVLQKIATRRALPDDSGITPTVIEANKTSLNQRVPLRLLKQPSNDEPMPVLLWFHGGGYVLGSAADNDNRLADIANRVRCAVLSVDYRLAPEHPYPAAIDDGIAALNWLQANGASHGLDASNVVIGGASAGAGLAAALALKCRDDSLLIPRLQLLIYPMLDDRQSTPSSHAITDPCLWNRATNELAWTMYLGEYANRDDVPAYAAPARAGSLNQLAPAFIGVGDLDLFLDEDIDYAQRLLQSGTPAELHIYTGAIHGFDTLAPDSALARHINSDVEQALIRAFYPK